MARRDEYALSGVSADGYAGSTAQGDAPSTASTNGVGSDPEPDLDVVFDPERDAAGDPRSYVEERFPADPDPDPDPDPDVVPDVPEPEPEIEPEIARRDRSGPAPAKRSWLAGRRPRLRTVASAATFFVSVMAATLGGMWLAQHTEGPAPGADAARASGAAPRLVTVPATPGLRVRVNGLVEVADENGAILLPTGLDDVQVDVLDLEGTTDGEKVTFSSWSDGQDDARRTISLTGGPIPELGLQRVQRVTLFAPRGLYRFSAMSGPATEFLLVPGEVAWVPAERTVATGDGFETQEVGYTLTDAQLAASGTTSPSVGTTYEPAPGVTWTVIGPPPA